MDDAAKLIKRARRDHAAGDRRSARKKYEQLLRRDPHHLDAHYLLGTLLAELKEWRAAESHLRTALSIKPDSGYTLMNLGTLCRLTGREHEALDCYRRAAERVPGEPDLLLNLGSLEAKLGFAADAEQHLGRFLLGQPGHADARTLLGDALRAQGRLDDAAAQYRAAIEIAGPTPALQFLLGCCDAAASPDAPPESYVRQLFDTFARTFDRHLMVDLECRIPDLIAEAVTLDSGAQRRFAHALDLGCGTGLTGARLRDRVDRLTGVDLSPNMVELARARGIYDAVEVADACTWLQAGDDAFDLVVAGDVVVYVGELGALFAAVAQRLRDDALFVISAEESDGDGFELRTSGRFAHAAAYVARTAERSGLRVKRLHRGPLRKEAGGWIDGFVAVLARN